MSQGWPPITLSSPFKTEPYMMPLSAFPEGFQADIAAWETRMLYPDPLNIDAPLRALRAADAGGVPASPSAGSPRRW